MLVVVQKRIIFGGSAGLLWYSYGAAAYLMEKWGDELTEDVSFEGVSGGCSAAWSMAIHSQLKTVSITEFAGVGIDGFVSRNQKEGWMGLWCFKAAWAIADKFWTMSEAALNKLKETSSRFKAGDTITSILEGKVVFWHTDAYTFKLFPCANLTDRNYTADAYLASCWVPGILGPALAVATEHLAGKAVALDGGVGLAAGDRSMFEPTHKDGKEIRTIFFEVYPTVPAPPKSDNLRVIKLWQWDDFRWYGVHQGLCNPKQATELYLRGYYTAQAHRQEVEEI